MKKTPNLRLRMSLVAGCAAMACGGAQAAITCSLSSNGFSSAYVPGNASINITAASFTMTCTRSVTGDATTRSYTVTANNGSFASGNQNRAAFGTNRILYDIYTDSSCSTQWKGTTTLGGTVTFTSTSDFTSKSQTIPYWGCIPAGQTTVAAGTYADTVTLNPSIGSNATLPVSIVTPSSCSISTPPGNMTFNYTAFQGSTASASTGFSAKCTNLLPYSMALDVTSSVLTGLAYTLSLSSSSNVGTGVAQAYTINGTMAAGQSGTCATGSCTATAARTLTITY